MSGCSYVERRGGRYYYRARVPLDIVPIAGRTHVVAALGTADARVAKIKSARLFLSFAAFLETMRLKMARTLDIDGNADARQLEILAARAFALGQEYEARKEDLKQEFSVRLGHLVASLRNTGYSAETAPPACGNMDGMIRFAAAREQTAAPAGPACTMAPPPSATVPASPAWTSLKQAFLNDKPGLSSKTIWSYNQAFDAWERLIGSKPVGEIRRPDVKALADHLRDRPSTRGGSLNYKSIERN